MVFPKNVGIIMDGNRRFAKRLYKKPWKGHEWGAKKVREVLKWCREFGIKNITLYSLSFENLNRPKKEFDMLMRLFKREFSKIPEDKDVHENEIKINVMGRIQLLPQEVQKAINKAVESTKNYNKFNLNFAIAYGGRQELIDTCKKISKKVSEGLIKTSEIDERIIQKHLYLNGGTTYPDLIIRTGGEKRLSNFLLWESAYSELYFTDKFWPDFNKENFKEALESFKERKRRFGK